MSIIDGIWIVWFTLFGSCIGSFANVVIWRLPLGMNLSRPGSHCPKCGHAIRWYHNIPILGWLWLRGKCADCREPISIRYPIVETVVAIFFLVVAIALRTLFDAAVNAAMPSMEWGPLDTTHSSSMDQIVNLSTYTKDPNPFPMVRLLIQAITMASIPTLLLMIGLIRKDRQRVPTRLWFFLAIAAIGLIVMYTYSYYTYTETM